MAEVMSHPSFADEKLVPLADACDVVLGLLTQHARRLGLAPGFTVGILENRDWTLGITEMGSLERFLTARGVRCVVGDPRDLRDSPQLMLAGKPIDLIYRNMELADFVALERDGHDMRAVRAAFKQNRVLSGLAGDFDHKSTWEVLTSKKTRHLIDPADRAFLRRHLLWTRLVRETRTEGPDGKMVELIPYIRTHQKSLVLKPNRACGGEGVTLGPLLPATKWKKALERALAEPGAWVVQRFHKGTQKHFPRRRNDHEPYFVTYGVVSSPDSFGVLGRACRKAIVNVSAGGGLVALLREP
jgi:diaminobutyrate-2-oxoglutarate transaminase